MYIFYLFHVSLNLMTMSFKWQDKHMELFLETYKQYECLWNNKCSNYSKSNAREKAYFLMLNDLNIPGLTVADIKAKIKTVRTRYGAELAKIRNSERNGAAGDEVYEPRLFWFKDADFLRKVCTSKPSFLMKRDQEEAEKEIPSEKLTNASQHFEDNDSTSAENSRNSPVGSRSNTCTNLPYCKNVLKRSFPNDLPVLNHKIKKLKQISDKQDPNEFDVFCKSLAIQLKKMPLQRAIICQEKLQSVMTQERLFQILRPHPSSLEISSTCQHSQSIDSQNIDHYSTIPSTDLRIDSIDSVESDTLHRHCQSQSYDGEGDYKSENISGIKKEI